MPTPRNPAEEAAQCLCISYTDTGVAAQRAIQAVTDDIDSDNWQPKTRHGLSGLAILKKAQHLASRVAPLWKQLWLFYYIYNKIRVWNLLKNGRIHGKEGFELTALELLRKEHCPWPRVHNRCSETVELRASPECPSYLRAQSFSLLTLVYPDIVSWSFRTEFNGCRQVRKQQEQHNSSGIWAYVFYFHTGNPEANCLEFYGEYRGHP